MSQRLAILLSVALSVGASGCRQVVVACAADGTCPAGSTCIEGLCKSASGGPSDSQGGTATADIDASDASDASACVSSSSGGPSARSGAAGGVLAGRLLLLGGDDAPNSPCKHLGRTASGSWQLNWCNGWKKLAGKLPPDRMQAASAAPTSADAIAIFGGRQRAGQGGPWTLFGDLWLLEKGEAWTRLALGGGPPPRSRAVLAMSPGGQIYLDGGDAGNSDNLAVPLADTWRFDIAEGKWRRLFPKGGPDKRYGHAGALTREGRYLVIVGGRSATKGSLRATTWRLDLELNEWQQLGSGATGPSPREGTGLLAIAGDPRLLLFGGRDAAIGPRNDLWVLDPMSGSWDLAVGGDTGANGRIVTPRHAGSEPCAPPIDYMAIDAQSPPARWDFLWGYEPQSGRLWLAGGRGMCGPLRDAWTLHLPSVSWQRQEQSETSWSCVRRGRSCSDWCQSQ